MSDTLGSQKISETSVQRDKRDNLNLFQQKEKVNPKRFAVKITLTYMIMGILWILFSDKVVRHLSSNMEEEMFIGMIKGWFYVVITGVIIYALIHAALIRVQSAERQLVKNYLDIEFTHKQLEAAYKELEASKEELKQQFDALKESEERYQKLVELSPDPIFMVDGDKVVFSNHAGAALLGYDNREELIGKGLDDFYPADSSSVLEAQKIFLNENRNGMKRAEYKLIRRDGEKVDVETVATNILYKGEKLLLSISRDITIRKKAEKEASDMLAQNERLLKHALEYDRLKTEFFSNISHEFKTPLNIILGAVQLLELVDKNGSCPSCHYYKTSRKYLQSMRQNCYRLLRLINNLIDITRLDTGFLKMNFRNQDIISIVEDITLSVKDYVESKGIALIFDTEVEEKIIACDADKIERIMLNLLSNAIKYTKPGGTIYINIYENEEHMSISVKDTGVGIPSEMISIIFERFRQVESLLTRQSEGSGIGLSLVKALVEAHGGSIMAKSRYGHGSEFVVKLPNRIESFVEDFLIKEEAVKQDKVERINIEFSDIYGT